MVSLVGDTMTVTDTESTQGETVAERLADMAFAVSEGNIEKTAQWLEKVGRKVFREDEQLTIQGVSSTVGLVSHCDPITALIQILFAQFGMFWPQISYAKEAIEIVNKLWAEKVKQAKTKAKSKGK